MFSTSERVVYGIMGTVATGGFLLGIYAGTEAGLHQGHIDNAKLACTKDLDACAFADEVIAKEEPEATRQTVAAITGLATSLAVGGTISLMYKRHEAHQLEKLNQEAWALTST